MTKFKVGDKFIPRKPKDVNESPYWEEEMDEFEGKLLTVSMINGYNNILAKETSWTFHPDWCGKLEEHIGEDNEMVPAHLIDKATKAETGLDKGIEVSEKDWEKRRYEIAKELLVAQLTSLYKVDTIWNYRNQITVAIEVADELIKQLKK